MAGGQLPLTLEEAGPDRTGVTKPEGFIDGLVEPRLLGSGSGSESCIGGPSREWSGTS